MNESIKVMASDLADKNKVVTFKQNSLFEAIEFGRGNDKLIGELASKIAAGVKNDLILIKGKLVPLMKEYAAYLDKKVLDAKEVTETSLYQVQEQSIPDVVKELQDKGIILAKRSIGEMPVAQLSIPLPSDDVIMSMFKHNISSIDMYASKIVDMYTKEEAKALWEKYLLNISRSNPAIDMMSFNSTSFKELIMLFLVLSNLREEKVAGVKASEETYKDIVHKFYSEVLNTLAIKVEKYQTDVRMNKLIADIKDEYTVVVNADVYDDFLNANGKPEVLFGLLLNRPNNVTGFLRKEIELKQDEYLKAWDKKVKMVRMNSKYADLKKYEAVYSISLRHLFEELIPGDLEKIAKTDIANAESLLKAKLAEEPINEVMDTEYMAREILAHIVFPGTNFHKFTDYMLEYVKLDPKLTSQEAASFASIDMIMDYLLQQVNTEDL